MTTPQETIAQQQIIIDALTAQVAALSESELYERDRCEERLRGAFPDIKRRENQSLYNLVMDACASQELLRVAKVENGCLARREDDGMPDSGRYSKAAVIALRKNLHQANSHLAEIKRLVKARDGESALEAVQRHFGQATQHGVKNIGAFFKGLRAILGIPDRDHGGLDAILKTVGALKEEAKGNTDTARGERISEAHAALAAAGVSEPGPLARKIGMLAVQRDEARSVRDSYWDRLCAAEKERDIIEVLHKSAERDNVRLTNEVSRLKTEVHDREQGCAPTNEAAEAARAFAGAADGWDGLWAEIVDRTVKISTTPPTYSEGFKSWCRDQGYHCGDQPKHHADPFRSLFRAYEAGRSEARDAALDPDTIVEPLAADSLLTQEQAFIHTAHRRIAESICVAASALALDPSNVSPADDTIRLSLRRALSLASCLADISSDRGFRGLGSTT